MLLWRKVVPLLYNIHYKQKIILYLQFEKSGTNYLTVNVYVD